MPIRIAKPQPKKRLQLRRPILAKPSYEELIGSVETIPYALPPRYRFALEVIYAPYSSKSMRICGFPKEMHDCPKDHVIVGLCYNQHAGIGPGHGTTVWLCRNLAHEPYARSVGSTLSPATKIVKGLKPYFKFLAEFKCNSSKSCDVYNARDAAVAHLIAEYEDLHDINFFSLD